MYARANFSVKTEFTAINLISINGTNLCFPLLYFIIEDGLVWKTVVALFGE